MQLPSLPSFLLPPCLHSHYSQLHRARLCCCLCIFRREAAFQCLLGQLRGAYGSRFQVGLSLFATVFAGIGLMASKEFQGLREEAKEFGLGSVVYCVVIIGVIVVFQLSLLGNVGVTFTSNAFFCGILNAALIPIIDIAGVLVYHEHFTAEKGLALALCLWGLVSYFYGEFKKTKNVDEASTIQISDDSRNV
ncbi:hypothetical protein Scep_000878 [Stephania cephalantha]|uniref:Uncharacterized protein n=1 Tax=Stephania cephalantha TaxID=152367 RepID=A0AAP0L6W2_9MAGN